MEVNQNDNVRRVSYNIVDVAVCDSPRPPPFFHADARPAYARNGRE